MNEQKKLINELRQFLQRGKRKQIALEDYIRLTESTKKWTKETIHVLYKAVRESRLVKVLYQSKQKEIENYEGEAVKVTYSQLIVKLVN